MSTQLVNLSPDLKRLRDAGYNIEIRDTNLLVHQIPYLDSNTNLKFGTLVKMLSGTIPPVAAPHDHVTYFIGEQPYELDGSVVQALCISKEKLLVGDVEVNLTFSNKYPNRNYYDYFELVEKYVSLISVPASSKYQGTTAKSFVPFLDKEMDSNLCYPDTNASRANIQHLSAMLKHEKVAIIGLGGTGSYVLDFVAKNDLSEIHLFDADSFDQHNAYRAPGAVSFAELKSKPSKVKYFELVYSNINKKVIGHPEFIDDRNIERLREMTFVFICVDKNSVRHKIAHFLMNAGIAFIDCGIGVKMTKGKLSSTIRVTCSIDGKTDHIDKRIPELDIEEDGLYATNIQVAELNAFAAILAIQLWKKKRGFYFDDTFEHNVIYSSLLGTIDYDD